jgi:dihydropteroate synthase
MLSWKVRDHEIDLTRSGRIMGILNVTPDSFSDGGAYRDPGSAVAHAEKMISEGASIIDVGGESTRPGADPVSVEEEIDRVIPVITQLRKQFPNLLISIDTYKAETASKAIHAGVDIVNDISALRMDPEMESVVGQSDVGVILTHMQGTPKTMQLNPSYVDPVSEIYEFLKNRCADLRRIDPDRIAIDPGFGFGKSVSDNLALFRSLDRFLELNRPIVVGVSRKSFINALLNQTKIAEAHRVEATAVLSSLLREKGAHILRVHDVRPNFEALCLTDAIVQWT